MSPLNVKDVTRIATEAAREESSYLRVVGVVAGARESHYAEVIIDIVECQREPCRMSLGVFRNLQESVLHDEIAARLRRRMRHVQESERLLEGDLDARQAAHDPLR